MCFRVCFRCLCMCIRIHIYIMSDLPLCMPEMFVYVYTCVRTWARVYVCMGARMCMCMFRWETWTWRARLDYVFMLWGKSQTWWASLDYVFDIAIKALVVVGPSSLGFRVLTCQCPISCDPFFCFAAGSHPSWELRGVPCQLMLCPSGIILAQAQASLCSGMSIEITSCSW